MASALSTAAAAAATAEVAPSVAGGNIQR